MRYIELLKQKIYIAVLMVCGFAALGSIWGAREESKEPITVYGRISDSELTLQESRENQPELAGYLPLAADQNKWYNFKYAAAFAGIGIFLYCILIAVYLPLYQLPFFAGIRKKLCGINGENNLFIKL